MAAAWHFPAYSLDRTKEIGSLRATACQVLALLDVAMTEGLGGVSPYRTGSACLHAGLLQKSDLLLVYSALQSMFNSSA